MAVNNIRLKFCILTLCNFLLKMLKLLIRLLYVFSIQLKSLSTVICLKRLYVSIINKIFFILKYQTKKMFTLELIPFGVRRLESFSKYKFIFIYLYSIKNIDFYQIVLDLFFLKISKYIYTFRQ